MDPASESPPRLALWGGLLSIMLPTLLGRPVSDRVTEYPRDRCTFDSVVISKPVKASISRFASASTAVISSRISAVDKRRSSSKILYELLFRLRLSGCFNAPGKDDGGAAVLRLGVCGVPGRLGLVFRSRLDFIDTVSTGSVLDAAVCIDVLLDFLDNIFPIFQRPEEVDF